MKFRYLGLFALAPVLSQCQPACAPIPDGDPVGDDAPAPVEAVVPAPVDTAAPVTVPVTTPPTTLPVIPLGVTINRECDNAAPAFSATNDSNRPIQFAWLGQHAILLGGESILREWPREVTIGQGLLDQFDWTATDPLNNAVFDSGTLFLADASGTMDCASEFNAVIDAATSCPTLDTVTATIFASAPVGYDEAAFVFHHVWRATDQLHDEVFSLPMTSDRNVRWSADVPAPDGFGLPALSATVSFIDNDGLLPTVVYPNGGDSNTTPVLIRPLAC